MKIKIFGKSDCAKCETTKNKVRHFIGKWDAQEKVDIMFHDMETIDGMAEGAYHDVLEIPTTIIEKDEEVLDR